MNNEDMQNYIVAAIKGIKEFGIADAFNRVVKADGYEDDKEAISISMLVALVAVTFPELVKDKVFVMVMGAKIMGLEKDIIDANCDAILNNLEGGNQ